MPTYDPSSGIYRNSTHSMPSMGTPRFFQSETSLTSIYKTCDCIARMRTLRLSWQICIARGGTGGELRSAGSPAQPSPAQPSPANHRNPGPGSNSKTDLRRLQRLQRLQQHWQAKKKANKQASAKNNPKRRLEEQPRHASESAASRSDKAAATQHQASSIAASCIQLQGALPDDAVISKEYLSQNCASLRAKQNFQKKNKNHFHFHHLIEEI